MPVFLGASAIQFTLLLSLLTIEIVRSVRQFETKIGFVIPYVTIDIFTAAIVAFLLWQVKMGWDDGVQQRANEAAKAEAAAEAEQTCRAQRKEEIDRTYKRRGEAYRALDACRKEFEKTKSFLSQATVEERCKRNQTYFEQSDREHKAANARTCTPVPKK